MNRANIGTYSRQIGDVTVTALLDGQFEGPTSLILGPHEAQSEEWLRETSRHVPPRRFTPKQYKPFVRRVSLWRQHARARGVVIGPKTYRRLSDRPRGRRPEIFRDHWEEMARCLEERPDQTALELLIEFQARYPGHYSSRQLHTLQKRVRTWRQQAVQRLIGEVSLRPPDVATWHPALDKPDTVLAKPPASDYQTVCNSNPKNRPHSRCA